jgi:alpha-glucosidase (family GH31 glycosyl hydrolase)
MVIEQHVEIRQIIEDTEVIEQNVEVIEKFQNTKQNIEQDIEQPEDIENVEQNVEVIDLTFDEDDDITTPASSSFSYTAPSTTFCTPFSTPSSSSLSSTSPQYPSPLTSTASKRSRDEYSSDSEDPEDERPAKRAALDQEMTRHRFQHD